MNDERIDWSLIPDYEDKPMKLSELTPEQKRIAIAEACGWEYDESMEMWLSPSDIHFFEWQIPDYLNDLNAMHEAEKTMSEHQWMEYYSMLDSITNRSNGKYWGQTRKMAPVFTTAAQRADAFLLTLNLTSL